MINQSATTKRVVLGIAGFLTALLFGWLLKHFFDFPSLGNLIFIALGAAIFLAFFLLQALLINDFWMNLAAIFFDVLALSLFTAGHSIIILLASAVICLILLVIAVRNTQSEITENLEIRFWKVSRVAMGLATIAIALFASLVYVGRFDLKNPSEAKKTLEVVIKPTEPLVAAYLPGFSASSSLRQIATNLLSAQLKLASEETKNQAINEASARLAQTLGGFAGTAVRPTDSLIDIIYKATIGRLLKQSVVVQNIFLLVVGLLLFLFLKFALFVVDWSATAASYGLYQILLAFKFFKIEVQNVPKKVIVLE